MTREQAKDKIMHLYGSLSEDMKQAIDVLVEDSKCERGKVEGINRQEVLDYIDRLQNSGTGKKKSLNFLRKYVEKMPTEEGQEPCEDAISRQAVDELSKGLVHTTRDKADFLCNFWEGLRKLPPVTPQPKTGQWIENAPECQNIDPPYICSECGNMHLRKTNYCDQCGAKMIDQGSEGNG